MRGCLTETADTAAVRASVMNRPSMIESSSPVIGSSRTIVARCVGSPTAVLLANTLTTFVPSAAGSGINAGMTPTNAR